MSITSKAKIFGTHSRDHESDCCQLKIETVSPSAKLKPDRLTASPEQRRYRSNFSQLSLVAGSRDDAEPDLAAGRMILRRQADPGCELPT